MCIRDRLYSAYAISVDNTKTINQIPLEESISKMEKAVKLDPFKPNIRVDLSKMQRTQAIQTKDHGLLSKAENNLKKAVKYTPYVPVVLQETVSYYISRGNFDEAFKYLDKTVEIAPLKEYSYEAKSSAYAAVAEYYINILGDIEKGVDIYRDHMLNIISEIQVANEKTTKPIQLTPNTLQNIFKAKYFVDNYKVVEKLNQLDDIVYISYLNLEGATGADIQWRKWDADTRKIEFDASEEGMMVYNTGENMGFVYSQLFSLEPEKTYEVEVVLSSKSNMDIISSRIINLDGKTTQASYDIKLNEIKNNTYNFSFVTTSDLKPGRQYIRFDHPGNSEDYFTIQQLIIKEID
jgi:tetratricopeptide (TPR) repeat protein